MHGEKQILQWTQDDKEAGRKQAVNSFLYEEGERGWELLHPHASPSPQHGAFGVVTRTDRVQKGPALHTHLPSPQLCSSAFPLIALLHKTGERRATRPTPSSEGSKLHSESSSPGASRPSGPPADRQVLRQSRSCTFSAEDFLGPRRHLRALTVTGRQSGGCTLY